MDTERVDLSDPTLKEAAEDVRNEKSPTNWVLYGYVKTSNVLKVVSTGEGGLAELMEELSHRYLSKFLQTLSSLLPFTIFKSR